MPVNLSSPEPADLHAVPASPSTAHGRRPQGKPARPHRRDNDPGAWSPAFHGQPVLPPGAAVPRSPAAGGEVQAILVNTGNANASTGADGLARALDLCRARPAARLRLEQVLPFSTGVIVERRREASRRRCRPRSPMRPDGWAARRGGDGRYRPQGGLAPSAARRPHGDRDRHQQGRRQSTPTWRRCSASSPPTPPPTRPDAASSGGRRRVVQCITIDGDTDQRFLRPRRHPPRGQCPCATSGGDGQLLRDAVVEVSRRRAGDRPRRRRRDEVHHRAHRRRRQRRRVPASRIRDQHSPLVKTAFFASDPNLGRILAAVITPASPISTRPGSTSSRRRARRRRQRAPAELPGGGRPARHEAERDRSASTSTAAPQRRQSDLRPELRLRRQRRLPLLIGA